MREERQEGCSVSCADREPAMITAEVAYARPDRQEIISLQVEAGCTAFEAVLRSGITELFPEIDPEQADMGIFSRPLDGKVLPEAREYHLEQFDRVEIYRPLLLDPKQARLLRAQKAREK